jgi:hypothetical protein
VQVTLYSKPGCHLCEQLKGDLALLQAESVFTLDERNIELNAEDFARFRYLIPVLEIEGVLYYPPHDLRQIRRLLRSAWQRPA